MDVGFFLFSFEIFNKEVVLRPNILTHSTGSPLIYMEAILPFKMLHRLNKKKLNTKNKIKILKSTKFPAQIQNCRIPKIKVRPINIKKV
jgi:hypothetical protein